MKPKVRLTEEQERAAERKLEQEKKTKAALLEFLRKHAEFLKKIERERKK